MQQDTSKLAFRNEVAQTLGLRQKIVLEAILRLGEGTNTEIAVHLGYSINRITPRCLELRQAGKVFDVGKRPCTITGRLAHVWSAKGELTQTKLL